MSDRIHARYLIETAEDVQKAVEIMAGEQSSGTFMALASETPELKARAGAQIERIELLGTVDTPSLPGARPGNVYNRAEVELSWPLANIGPSLPNLIATVTGNLYELKAFSGLRILDIDLPEAFAARYQGPAFGIEGTRILSGVSDLPLIGTIIKPSVGLSPVETAELVERLCRGGIDFIKDDELQADGPACPFAERAEQVMAVINAHAERTGRKVMYAFNITGELDEMRARHDLIEKLGGTCVMASLNSIGMVGMVEIRRHSRLPIHAHRNGWGYLSRHPMLGWSYTAWAKLWRLAGADHMHVNGLRNKFCETDESVIASARSMLTPMFTRKPCLAMPVLSSGQSAVQVADTYKALGSTDLIFAAGGGIMGHPQGVEAGVTSLRQAWQVAVEGGDPMAFPELQAALAQYA